MAESEIIAEPVTSTHSRRKASFAGDVLKLVGGTTFAQVLGILVAPLLTRLYAPEAFGLSALFASITSIISVIVCMRYEASIMLPESDEKAANLLSVSLGFVVLVSSLTGLTVWLGRQSLVHWLSVPELGSYLWLVPLAVFVAGVFQALNYWNSRTGHFGRLSIARVTSSVTTSIVQLGAGYAGYVTGGSLISAGVIGSVASTLVLSGQIWRDDKSLFRHSISWRDMVLGLKQHRKFPLYSTWSALLNSISWHMPVFLLMAFFSSEVVGYYSLGTRLLRLPMSLIGSAIAQVFFQRAAEAKVDGTLSAVVESTFQRLVTLGLFPMLLLTFIGRDIFVVVLGDNWAEAGVYVQILSIWMFFWFISSPLFTLVSVLEKQEYGLIFNIFTFTMRLVSLWIGGLLGNVHVALILFAVSGFLTYGGLNLVLLAASGVPWSRSGGILLSTFILFIPVGVFLTIVKSLGVHSVILVGMACTILGIYSLYVFKSDPQIRRVLGSVGIQNKRVHSNSVGRK